MGESPCYMHMFPPDDPQNPLSVPPPSKRASHPTTATTKGQRAVVVVRHGERLDYVMRDRGENWIPSSPRPWDPPLTDHGKAQAKALGKALPMILSELGLPPIKNVYSSPFHRCRQTAAGLCEFSSSSSSSSLKVRVEVGLVESLNQNWFRSWALQGTDGTWGFGKETIADPNDLDPKTLHPLSQQPVQALLDWKQGTTDHELQAKMDDTYKSRTSIDQPYSLRPPLFENYKIQRRRMHETLQLLSSLSDESDDDNDNNNSSSNTIVLVSHGGPVTHLFESLTGEKWTVHGTSRYCCYSIYQQDNDDNWKALVVNQVWGEAEKDTKPVNDKTETSSSTATFTWA